MTCRPMSSTAGPAGGTVAQSGERPAAAGPVSACCRIPATAEAAGMSARQGSGATTGRALQVPATRGCPIAAISPVPIPGSILITAGRAGIPALQPRTVPEAPAGPARRGANGAMTGARARYQTHMPAVGVAMSAPRMSSAKTAGVFPVHPGRAGVYGWAPRSVLTWRTIPATAAPAGTAAAATRPVVMDTVLISCPM